MNTVQKVPFVENWHLPSICRRANCLADPAKGSDYCAAHRPKPKSKKHPWRDKRVVYFIACPDTGLVKIGVASDFSARLSSIQSGCSTKLEVLAVFEGDKKAEAVMHRRLSNHCIRGEWFSDGEARALAKQLAGSDAERFRAGLGDVLVSPDKID